MRYRVMVVGEDHTEFCYSDDLTDFQIDDEVKDAEADYPCGKVFVEQEENWS